MNYSLLGGERLDAFVVGLLFLIPGIIFLIFVLLKYTEEEHLKEVKNWKWRRNDTYASWAEQDMVLFHKIASESYIIVKIILICYPSFQL